MIADKLAPRKELWAWAFYDFANSGYTTVVLTTVYSAYFVAVIGAGMDERSPGSATFAWTLAIGAANLFVLLTGPVIGAIADRRAYKKRFLLFSSVFSIPTFSKRSPMVPGPSSHAVIPLP